MQDIGIKSHRILLLSLLDFFFLSSVAACFVLARRNGSTDGSPFVSFLGTLYLFDLCCIPRLIVEIPFFVLTGPAQLTHGHLSMTLSGDLAADFENHIPFFVIFLIYLLRKLIHLCKHPLRPTYRPFIFCMGLSGVSTYHFFSTLASTSTVLDEGPSPFDSGNTGTSTPTIFHSIPI